MNRVARRRHLYFLSASLIVHLLFVLVLVGVLVIISDTPPIDWDRPLVVSLDRDNDTGDAPSVRPPREKIVVPKKESPRPDTSTEKVPGDTERRDTTAEEGSPATISGVAPEGVNGNPAALADYIRSIRARIERHKRYPPAAARDDIEGTVTVSFLLDRHGFLLEKGIVAGSGYPILDEAALATIGNSSPFPPFPEELHRETLLLKLPINYKER